MLLLLQHRLPHQMPKLMNEMINNRCHRQRHRCRYLQCNSAFRFLKKLNQTVNDNNKTNNYLQRPCYGHRFDCGHRRRHFCRLFKFSAVKRIAKRMISMFSKKMTWMVWAKNHAKTRITKKTNKFKFENVTKTMAHGKTPKLYSARVIDGRLRHDFFL